MKYLIIAHRVNTLAKLAEVPTKYGVEIDVRHNPVTGRQYLNHDPGQPGQEYADLEEYLAAAQNHAFVIFNIKDTGTESACIALAAKFGIADRYFLLDTEFPYNYQATRKGIRSIAIRYSEDEPIEDALSATGRGADWIWIDVNTRLPLDDPRAVEVMTERKTCLVSPDRWRPDKAEMEIREYRRKIEEMGFPLTAVMVGLEHAHLWE